jgi:hypothetical protein
VTAAERCKMVLALVDQLARLDDGAIELVAEIVGRVAVIQAVTTVAPDGEEHDAIDEGLDQAIALARRLRELRAARLTKGWS